MVTNVLKYSGSLMAFTVSDTKTVMKRDGVEINDVDLQQLYIACNVYANLCFDIIGADFQVYMIDRLTSLGLVKYQAMCDACYTHLVNAGVDLNGPQTDLFSFLSRVVEKTDGLRLCSIILRFLKRFTYNKGSIDPSSFIACDRGCWTSVQHIKRSWPYARYSNGLENHEAPDYSQPRVGMTLILEVKRMIDAMIGSQENFILLDGLFSGGNCSEGTRLRSKKIYYVSQVNPWFQDGGYWKYVGRGTVFSGHKRCQYLVPRAVPKNLTNRRWIAPEPAYRGFYASRVRQALERCLRATGAADYINWDDQSINRDLAQYGSAFNTIATIDMSSASDTISRELIFMCFPEWLRPYIYNSISDYYMMDGVLRRFNMFSASGNQLTWLIEAIWFRAIALVAQSFEQEPVAYAYGDDLIVPSQSFEAVTQLLEIFGHRVNTSKSYYTGPFRESCGGDFYNGLPMTPFYWKRGIVDLVRKYPEALASLCSLQHRLYEFCRARLCLNGIVRYLDPDITYSPVGDECDDLWDGAVGAVESTITHHRHLHVRYKHKCVSDALSYIGSDIAQAYMDWQYYQFLRDGRRYCNDDDRRFGISLPYLQLSDLETPSFRWR